MNKFEYQISWSFRALRQAHVYLTKGWCFEHYFTAQESNELVPIVSNNAVETIELDWKYAVVVFDVLNPGAYRCKDAVPVVLTI